MYRTDLHQIFRIGRHVGGLINRSFNNAIAEGTLPCSDLFFSHPRSEGWPHYESTFSIYFCPLPIWLTLLWRVLSTSWCCPSSLCVAFLVCVHLAFFFALSLFPGNSLVSSWCGQVFNSSFLTPALLRTHSFVSFRAQICEIGTSHLHSPHCNSYFKRLNGIYFSTWYGNLKRSASYPGVQFYFLSNNNNNKWLCYGRGTARRACQ